VFLLKELQRRGGGVSKVNESMEAAKEIGESGDV
jgi:hypothetical protein